MRALLDTNIIIHRENTIVTSQTIGQLFYWLDKLHYEKLIHPLSMNELRKLHNPQMQALYDAKLSAYTQMHTVARQTDEYTTKLNDIPKTDNDRIDNQLLFEVYCGRADILITEDRRLRNKACRVGLSSKVFSIDAFISKCTAENPDLLDYKALSVKKVRFGEVDILDHFFDTFRNVYLGFDNWFARKCDEEAYICRNDKSEILGFLYLKTEDETENYADITPLFSAKRRLKIGTFKVESTGFRLGERFVKIIFDNAIERGLDEIYVTLFLDRPELVALYDLLTKWGFYEYGTKTSNGSTETVLVKKLGIFDPNKTVIENYPNLDLDTNKYILPILPQYHTSLFPDSALYREREINIVGDVAHRYALQKAYITWADCSAKPGDIILFYRMGDSSPKKYSSVLTTVGVVDCIVRNFRTEDEFLSYCNNRTVFPKESLQDFWRGHRYNLSVVKFVFVKSFSKKVNLEFLWNNGIIAAPNGPRPFTKITNEQFEMIMKESNTEIHTIGE